MSKCWTPLGHDILHEIFLMTKMQEEKKALRLRYPLQVVLRPRPACVCREGKVGAQLEGNYMHLYPMVPGGGSLRFARCLLGGLRLGLACFTFVHPRDWTLPSPSSVKTIAGRKNRCRGPFMPLGTDCAV